LWDLVSAFGRIMREQSDSRSTNIVYDDTPIRVYMGRIRDRLVGLGKISLGELFQPGMHKSTLVGLFLAILELVRHHSVQAEQQGIFGEIWLRPGPDVQTSFDAAEVDEYDAGVSPPPDETPG
jgi:segregation and condensation protein A